jgi:2,4-dienoyl-CoA reductase-like NADH-dependent reductase (Old Yellow Enzyme family)
MLIRRVESFLRETGLPATSFGRLAAADPRLVVDLRNGREPRKRMVLRLEHFMNTFGESRNAG